MTSYHDKSLSCESVRIMCDECGESVFCEFKEGIAVVNGEKVKTLNYDLPDHWVQSREPESLRKHVCPECWNTKG